MATTALASTIMEIINDRLRAIAAVQEQKIAHKLLEPLLTKKQAVEYFQVSLRTIESGSKKVTCPLPDRAGMVRIKMSDVEGWWNEKYMVRRRSWSR